MVAEYAVTYVHGDGSVDETTLLLPVDEPLIERLTLALRYAPMHVESADLEYVRLRRLK